jgi:hypothetical protein
MTAGMKYFSKRLDEIFEQGMPTKAQILDAFNKGIKAAIAERMPTDCRTCNELDHPCWIHDPTNPDNNKRMPTEKDAIRYAADATELDASEEPHTDIEKMDTFLHGTRWFRSRIEEKK